MLKLGKARRRKIETFIAEAIYGCIRCKWFVRTKTTARGHKRRLRDTNHGSGRRKIGTFIKENYLY
jgi:hypothetical protein